MDPVLELGGNSSGQQVSIGISEHKHGLEEEQANYPNRSRATQLRQDHLRDHGLNLEKEESADENSQPIKQFW